MDKKSYLELFSDYSVFVACIGWYILFTKDMNSIGVTLKCYKRRPPNIWIN